MGLNSLTGGAFQDCEGNVLANGFLIFELSHDEQETSTTPNGQVVGGLKKRISLDNNGNCASGSQIWPNDVMNPANSFYIVNAYRADGVLAWRAPQYWTILSSPNPFDLGTLVPTNPPGSGSSSGAPIGSLLLQTNEVNNGSQSVLDLHAGTNITLADNGSGRVTITASGGGGFSSAGFGGFYGPGLTNISLLYGAVATSVPSNTVSGAIVPAGTLTVFQFILESSWTISKITTRCLDNVAGTSQFAIYSSAGALRLDTGSYTNTSAAFQTKSITPVVLPAGVYWHAQAASTAAAQPHFPGILQSSSGQAQNFTDLSVQNATRAATAQNLLAAGAMPATLGTLTPFDPNGVQGDGVCCPFYEP